MPDGLPLYVPLTLPGERVHVRPIARQGEGYRGEAEAILQASAARDQAACPHFGACGGCTLQHWQAEAYRAWKAGLLLAALQRAGFADAAVAPLVPGAPGQRRRMDLAARRSGGVVTLGLHRLRGEQVVDLASCPVLHPDLAGLLAPLRDLLAGLTALRRQADVVVNLLHSGPDLLLRLDAPLSVADRGRLAGFAGAHGLCRVAFAAGHALPEPVCQLRPVAIDLSGVSVAPPPGGFLQATAAGEAAIVAAVLAGLPTGLPARARVADLYAGCGTLSLALARHARVLACEGDPAAAAALQHAANRSQLAGRITVQTRDLVRQPLLPTDCTGLAAVVLDPPFAGAAAQVAQLAQARVPVVVYVSCSPAALARDARVLHQAGYRLTAATPIDQFLWSSRLEAVCVFRQGSPT